MNVVITGAKGFLGSRLTSRMKSDGHVVLAVDRTSDNEEGSHASDLDDPHSLFPTSGLPSGPFALIHLAWDTRREGATYRAQSKQITILAGLFETWRDRGLSQIIVAGSAAEYGHVGGILQENTTPEGLLSPYGWAKRVAHDFSVTWAEQNGVDLLWMRPFIVYGPGQTGDMAIPYALRQARAGKPAEFTDGLQERDFVYSDDVVDAFALGLAKRPRGVHTLNIGRGEAVRLRDMLDGIASRLQAENLFVFGKRPRRPDEPALQIADVRRAQEVLGWTSTTDCAQGLDRLIDHS